VESRFGGTLESAAKEKGFNEQDIERFVNEIKLIIKEKF